MELTTTRLQQLLADAKRQREEAQSAAIHWDGRCVAIEALIDLQRQPEPPPPAPTPTP
jgi:hypothetical protein